MPQWLNDLIVWFGSKIEFFIGGTVVTLIAIFINKQIQNRIINIKELEFLSKFVEDFIVKTNIPMKDRLAEYYMHLAPTEELRKRWEKYRKNVTIDFIKEKEETIDKLGKSIRDLVYDIGNLKRDKSADEKTIEELQQKLESYQVEIEKIEYEATPRFMDFKSQKLVSVLIGEEFTVDPIYNYRLRDVILESGDYKAIIEQELESEDVKPATIVLPRSKLMITVYPDYSMTFISAMREYKGKLIGGKFLLSFPS